ncbi:hypothetical protein Pa4123_90930 [Phytohabitans aurantiacus]|uniref:PPE family domain-containing protein n=1 Tax=Phytohabitans aurantiacus TaxID=3016789 RepID=A0ABQ5RC46_9ACTN|nr:hypothetical protein Pa4123_90930 [Phytohabitans aurantiacus]
MSWERSGIPGGYTGTDWRRHDVTSMWQAVEDQHTDGHWKLVSGWRRTAELTSTHLSRLEQYRANLIAAWPPDRNAAAAAYVSRLDFLIQNVRTTHEVAVANYTTFGATVGALAGAQRDLKPLHDEYIRTLLAIRDHEALVAHNAASEAVSTVGRPPATRADLEVLNNRARAIMFSLSHTLIEAEAALKHPPTYMPQSTFDYGDPDIYSTEGAERIRPSQTASTAGTPDAVRDGRAPQLGSPTTNRPAAQSPTPSPSRIRPTSSSTISPASDGSSERTIGSRSGMPTEALDWPRRTPAPGGLIGQVPGSSIVVKDARTPSRVNPAGGVIGSPVPSPLFASRPIDPRRDPNRLRSNTNTPWETLEGISPVITPPKRADSFDPGPAIGL